LNIYFKHHSAGLVNQIMSVETAFGLAFLEKAKLYIYHAIQAKEMPILMPKNLMSFVPLERYKLYEGSANPNIFELLNLPVIIEYELVYDKIINKKLIEDSTSYCELLNYYYNCGGSVINEERFAEGRYKLIVEPNKNLHLHKCTFPLYSRFFYNRTAQLDRFLSEISFKEPYQILAKRIAEYIGKFKGIHLRLTDHSHNYNNLKETSDYVKNLFHNADIPLIVSSDDKETVKNIFNDKCIFIDDIIQNQFRDEFMNLPFHNEIVFGMISLLAMGYSEEFIGTPGSTFSGYIHRLRVLRGFTEKMNYIPSASLKKFDGLGKPYSWNNSDLNTNTKSWYREWPECKLNF